MKKNKGFTLIELLAVIVILAILMVIAVPKILKVIENSRSSAAESSIKLIKDGIKTNVAAAELTNENLFTKTDGCYLFDFDTPNANVNNLDIDNKEKAGGSIKLCNGKFTDDTLSFDGSNSSNTEENSNRFDLLQYVLSQDSDLSYGATLTKNTGYFNIVSSYGGNGGVQIPVSSDKEYSKIHIKGYRHTTDSSFPHFYVGINSTNHLLLEYPTVDSEFEYDITIPDGSTITNTYFEYCVGSFDITEWYLE